MFTVQETLRPQLVTIATCHLRRFGGNCGKFPICMRRRTSNIMFHLRDYGTFGVRRGVLIGRKIVPMSECTRQEIAISAFPLSLRVTSEVYRKAALSLCPFRSVSPFGVDAA